METKKNLDHPQASMDASGVNAFSSVNSKTRGKIVQLQLAERFPGFCAN